jgi:hypothetical protein
MVPYQKNKGDGKFGCLARADLYQQPAEAGDWQSRGNALFYRHVSQVSVCENLSSPSRCCKLEFQRPCQSQWMM